MKKLFSALFVVALLCVICARVPEGSDNGSVNADDCCGLAADANGDIGCGDNHLDGNMVDCCNGDGRSYDSGSGEGQVVDCQEQYDCCMTLCAHGGEESGNGPCSEKCQRDCQ